MPTELLCSGAFPTAACAKSCVHVAGQPGILAATMHSEALIPLHCELGQTELDLEQKCP